MHVSLIRNTAFLTFLRVWLIKFVDFFLKSNWNKDYPRISSKKHTNLIGQKIDENGK